MLHPPSQVHLALQHVQLPLERQEAGQTLGALRQNLLQAAEALDDLGLGGEGAAVGDEGELHPGHQSARPTRPPVETGGELVEQVAGERAVDALDGVLNGGAVGGVQARFEQVDVVGAEGLREDGGEGLVGGGHDGGPGGLGGEGVAGARGLLQQGGHVDGGLVAPEELAKGRRGLLLAVLVCRLTVVLCGRLAAVVAVELGGASVPVIDSSAMTASSSSVKPSSLASSDDISMASCCELGRASVPATEVLDSSITLLVARLALDLTVGAASFPGALRLVDMVGYRGTRAGARLWWLCR
ncbi:hypothetical protein V2G26_006369 [Clonostachys chloroleuca]